MIPLAIDLFCGLDLFLRWDRISLWKELKRTASIVASKWLIAEPINSSVLLVVINDIGMTDHHFPTKGNAEAAGCQSSSKTEQTPIGNIAVKRARSWHSEKALRFGYGCILKSRRNIPQRG